MLTTSTDCGSFQWIGPDGDSDSTIGTTPGGSILWTLTDTTWITSADIDEYDPGLWAIRCISADGCSSDLSEPDSVIIHAIPPAPTAANNSPVCEGEDLELTASTIPGVDYLWVYPNGDTSSFQNPTVYGAVQADSGWYYVQVIANDCPSEWDSTWATIASRPSLYTVDMTPTSRTTANQMI